MSGSYKLRKGFDIRIKGAADLMIEGNAESARYGVKPVDFPGLIPKIDVKPGENVRAGDALFHDKIRPGILFTSPVSGKISSIERGERRKILEVVIEKNGDRYVDFGIGDPATLSAEKIKEKLLKSGLWPAIRQRPYHVIANPSDTPKAIFISGFDSGPLAPDFNFIMENTKASYFQAGLDVLKKLTGGKLHLVLRRNARSPEVLTDAGGVEISYFSGPHPSGNVGIHIHHIDPVNKGEVVWIVNLQDIGIIGKLFEEGIYHPERIVALTGSEVIHPQYYRMISGASIASLVDHNVKDGNLRYISGNVLTGLKIPADGFLGYYDSQITVIPEGNYFEFFGWAAPGFKKFSFYRTFASRFLPARTYRLDTNFHGGERAFVMTGQYEKVLPMDIFPMQLLKAILARDIDLMENLGIYEVAEEDFALCEYICPSKIEIQSILRDGLDLMIKEMN